MKVEEIMSSPVYTVSLDKSISYVSDRMNEFEVGSLIVVDYGEVLGIITSRDVRSSHPNRIVADAMTPNPVSVPADQFIWDSMRIMDRRRIERLLVTKAGEVVGLITRESVKTRLHEIFDPLTGLYRAPYIHSIGKALLEEKRCFQLLFLDLNNFGEINKMYGHPVGDDVIQKIAAQLKSVVVEERDFLCRYAGDEFVVISLGEDHEVEQLMNMLSMPVIMDSICVSAAVGIVNGRKEPDFFSLTFREIISRASLQSTSLKQK